MLIIRLKQRTRKVYLVHGYICEFHVPRRSKASVKSCSYVTQLHKTSRKSEIQFQDVEQKPYERHFAN